MIKCTVAILNYNRPYAYVENLIESIKKQKDVRCEILVASNQKGKQDDDSEYSDNINYLWCDCDNIADAKNNIINHVRDNKLPFHKLFIIEDDIEILRDDTLYQYLKTMEVLKLGTIFNSYTNHMNYIITKPSPRTNIKLTGLCDIDGVTTNRFECGDFILIDLEKNNEMFNTELKYFEFAEWCFRCWKEGHIYALNQFLDIPESWTYIQLRKDCKSLREATDKLINDDRKKMDELIENKWVVENNIGIVVDKIRKTIGV